MKKVSIFMLGISMYSINSMDIKQQVLNDISCNQQLRNAFSTHAFNPLCLQNPSTIRRLDIFASITKEIDLKQHELKEKKRRLASEIQIFIATENCNKRKTYPQYGYTLYNKNGMITETKNMQKPTYFNAKDVRGIRIDDNFSIQVLF